MVVTIINRLNLEKTNLNLLLIAIGLDSGKQIN